METNTSKAWVFGDNVSTDAINPGQYLKLTAEEAAKHIMEGIDPDFPNKFSPGDFIVAGRNFGCGSSRESAPAALHLAGVQAVIAQSFARIFFRNAINVGLPALECAEAGEIREGDRLRIDLEQGWIINETQDKKYRFKPFPDRILQIIRAGGLVPFMEQELLTRTNK